MSFLVSTAKNSPYKLLAALLAFLQVSLAAADCPRQNYDSDKEPDYNCPGPDEETLVPLLPMVESIELIKGKPAPWDGVLMDKNQVLFLGLRVKALRRIRFIERQTCKQKIASEVEFAKTSAKAQLDLALAQRDSYKEQLAQSQKEVVRLQAWYRSWTFGLVVGIVVTVAGTTALAFALR